MEAPPNDSQFQSMLQRAVQSVQWTYSLFWQMCPQQGILVWADGYYNGAIKTRKTVQPMEVSSEEASLQRSQQLRELYESLSAGETNQPARRPCAALSPEDLTESEWFYLMCVSFSFPPGLGLPGKAYTKRQHLWLTGANEVDSKTFTRAILAKTVVCIPLPDGVVEFGTTDKVPEDLGLIQHLKTFFVDHQQHLPPPKPALSEHSTSNPDGSSNHPRFQSPPIPDIYTSADPPENPNQEDEDGIEEDEDDEEVDESESEEAETGRNIHAQTVPAQNPTGVAAAAEPSELMQLEMSEDIRLGSPDDASNNLDSNFHLLAVSQSGNPTDNERRDDSYRAESTRRWPIVADPMESTGLLQTLPSEAGEGTPSQRHEIAIQGGGGEGEGEEEVEVEDTHYSQTVSTILHNHPTRWADSSTSAMFTYVDTYPSQSAFSKWNPFRADHHASAVDQVTTSSQWLLKYILFSVPFLHTKYRDENSPKSSRDADSSTASRFRKPTPQDELSANHVLAERRRREKLNERFIMLRSLVPFVTKMDKASILGDTIEYVKQLRKKIQDLESRNRQMETDQRTTTTSGSSKEQQQSGVTAVDRTRVSLPGSDKRKLRIVEGSGGAAKPKTLLRELRIETTTAQSSLNNGIFGAELRAKVKDNVNGKKRSIVEVKRAINQIIPHSDT
ncbi:hypothetical protein FNV43_RR23403 [Rhamnella rubrinervis]|uniref:BHLH domain-containing protein n=1 Tax=Rhamnella rubrinervis TaxID=2594499 RepID=A0A8K0DT99_9ROSA|nr:hypothetical protein FNV43_RR23403 [Rhamnella rubrinervis]